MSEVISKVGIHCVGPRRNGYGPFCQTIADAGRRLSLVKVRDDFGAVDQPLVLWPDVLCLGAITDYDGFPFDFDRFVARAQLKPQIKVWEVLNEINGQWVDQANFYIANMPRFAGLGWKLCMFNCASGTPPYPVEDGGIAYQEIARACKFAKDNGFDAYLGLHEYQSDGGTIGRFKVLADYLEAHGALIPIVITEYGFETHPGDAQFMAMIRANEPVYADPRIVGCATWTLGGGGWQDSNYENALPQLAEYIATVQPIEPPPANEFIFQHYADALTGAIISTDPNYNLTLLGDMAIKAQYVPKPPPPVQWHEFTLTVDPPSEAQRVTQTPSGTMFPHGQVIQLRAV